MEVKNFIISVIRLLELNEDKIKIAAISFSETSQVEFGFNDFKMRQDQIEAIRRIQYVGLKTNVADALKDATETIFTANNGDRSVQRLK